jgi:hypothetical protein
MGADVKCVTAGPWKLNFTFDGSNAASPVSSTVTVEPGNASAPFDVIVASPSMIQPVAIGVTVAFSTNT